MAKKTNSSRQSPPVGALVQLHHFSDLSEYVFVSSVDNFSEIEVKNGTIALVVGHFQKNTYKSAQTKEQTVPIVLVNGFCGWIFQDEWDLAKT